jgi:site-specific DNA-methyltransferase (adenine-specific)
MNNKEVIQGDCLEVMKSIPDESIDAIITDPPYGLPNEDFNLVKRALVEIKRISKMQIVILDWRNPLTVDDGKFAELVWEYGWISGGRTKSKHFYPTHNTIHFLGENLFNFDTKNGSILKRQAGFSSPRQCSYANKTGHPYEKPLRLMEYLVERSMAEMILDPFAGSGTTGVACKNLNRNFILIEKEPKYIEIINKRLLNYEQ